MSATRASIEGLELRQLLSGTANLLDPSEGMSSWVVNTAHDYGDVVLPQQSKDGKTITVTGTSLNDVITVQRVTDISADIDDGEADVAAYANTDGSPIWMSGNFLSQYADAQWMDDYRADLAEQEHSLAQMKQEQFPDSAAAIAGFQKGVDQERAQIETDERFVQKFANGDFVRVTLAGVYDYFFDVTQMSDAALVIDAGAGADSVSVGSNVPLVASITGGSGADTLVSGRRKSVLMGGGGNDRLISRSVQGGMLDGGRGADSYTNRATTRLVGVKARADGDRLDVGGSLVPATRPISFRALGLFPTRMSIALKHGGYKLFNGDNTVASLIA